MGRGSALAGGKGHDGRWLAVAAVAETWRVDEGWWRGTPISRLYFAVVLEEGRALTLFQDLLGEGWYVQ